MAGSTNKAPITPPPPTWLHSIPVHHGDEIGGQQIQFIRYQGAQNFSVSLVKTTIWQKRLISTARKAGALFRHRFETEETAAIPKVRL